MTMKELSLADINGSIDDVSVVSELERGINEIVQQMMDPAFEGKGQATLTIKLERVRGADAVVRAVGDVSVKRPRRVRDGTLLFPGDDGVVRAQGQQLDVEGVFGGTR